MPTPAVRALLDTARLAADTDADLLARFAAHRDEPAFAELVRRHGPLVRGAARRVAGHPDAAADAFQAAFLLLARKAAAGGWGPTVGPWLYRVACRAAGKARVRAARRPAGPLGGDVPAPSNDPASGLAWAEVRGAIDAALAGLPARLRDPLVLCYLEGLTRDEAAVALGCSPAALKGRVARGRDRLRRGLAARGLALPAALAGALVGGGEASAAEAAALARAAVAYRVTGAAPRAVRPLLRGAAAGWASAAGVAGLALVCGVAVLTGSGTPPAPATAGAADRPPLGPPVQLGTADLRHPGELTHLRFSADGRELVSYGRTATRRWDARTGRPVLPSAPDIPAPGDGSGPWVNWSSPIGDGTALVAVQLTETPPYRLVVRRYDLGTGRHEDLFELPKRKNPKSRFGSSYALSPDGALLAREDDGTVTVWDLRTRVPRHTFDLPGERSFVAQFTPDAAHLLTTEQGSRTVRFWDTRTGAQARSLTRAGGRLPQSGLSRLAVSPDGRRVAAVDNSHLIDHGTELTVWDLDRPDRPQVLTLERGFGPGGALAFAPDGTLYTVGDPDFGGRTFVGRWDVGGGRLLVEWEGPGLFRQLLTAAVSPDGTAVAVGTGEGVIALYDARTEAAIAPGGFHAAGVTGMSFDPTGRAVRTAAEDGSAADWTARTGEAIGRYPPAPLGPTERAVRAVVTPDGRWVLTPRPPADRSSPRRAATLRDPAAGGRGSDWEVAGRVVSLLSVPSGGRLVCRYVAEDGHRVQVRDAATGAVIAAIDRAFHPDRTRYAVALDGRSLVACDQESVVGYDLGTGRERFAWKLADRAVVGPPAPAEGPAPVLAIAASPDGRTLAVSVGGTAYVDPAKRTAQLVLVEAGTGAVVRRTRTPETAAGWLVFAPDGRRLAGPRCVWEVGTLAEVRRFPARPAVTAAGFSPDGRRVATGHANGTAAVWPLDAD